MHCQAVMHDYILVKMPKMETLVQMKRSQEVSARYRCYFLFLCEKQANRHFPPSGPDIAKFQNLC